MKRTPPLQNVISDSGDPFLTSFDLFQSCPNRRHVVTVLPTNARNESCGLLRPGRYRPLWCGKQLRVKTTVESGFEDQTYIQCVIRTFIILVAGVFLTLSLISLSGTFIFTLPFVLGAAYLYWNHGGKSE